VHPRRYDNSSVLAIIQSTQGNQVEEEEGQGRIEEGEEEMSVIITIIITTTNSE